MRRKLGKGAMEHRNWWISIPTSTGICECDGVCVVITLVSNVEGKSHGSYE
jgi:hypothetical protein